MFGEKKKENDIPVIQTQKYKATRKVIVEIVKNNNFGLTEDDFWIARAKAKDGKSIYYTGLIISHQACQKVADKLSSRIDPASFSYDKDGYKNSLVYEYRDADTYEVGEANEKNCKNDYPYAMAFKRCYDRVVLSKSKLRMCGIYSEVEADEFKEKSVEKEIEITEKADRKATKKEIEEIKKKLNDHDFMDNAYTTKATLRELGITKPNDVAGVMHSAIVKIRGAIVADIGIMDNAKLSEEEKAGIY